MFVGDYRPTKRVGIEELDGALNMFEELIVEAYENADARQRFHEGAYVALQTMRFGHFEYPRDFVKAYLNNLDKHIEGRREWDSASGSQS